MHGFDVNWLAVLLAAIVRFAIGGVWFAPFAFGPAWGRMVGINAEAAKARMGRAMAVDFIAGFILAWVLANVLQFLGVNRLVSGLGSLRCRFFRRRCSRAGPCDYTRSSLGFGWYRWWSWAG